MTTGTRAEASASTTDEALGQAAEAASRSRVDIRVVHDLDDCEQIIALFDGIWGTAGQPPIGLEHMRALAHGGNYVAAAYDDTSREMLGASVAFFASPVGHVLHSDVTGVHATARDRKLGFAIKLHQRSWGLVQGLSEITWTYDPLISRNAYFNLCKLGASGSRYYVDFYGDMSDGINVGQGSDRLLASWRLNDPAVISACSGRAHDLTALVADLPRWVTDVEGMPVVHDGLEGESRIVVAVPPDIEALRCVDPERSREWRMAIRGTLGAALTAGGTLAGFVPGVGYVVERGSR